LSETELQKGERERVVCVREIDIEVNSISGPDKETKRPPRTAKQLTVIVFLHFLRPGAVKRVEKETRNKTLQL